MAKKKKVEKIIKLHIPAGKANPAPPIGPALGAAQINMMGFCKEFNARTQKQAGQVLPTVITVYADKSFDFITKQPPMAKLIMEEAGVPKGSGVPNRDKVGKLTKAQVRKIAERKQQDLRVNTIEAADNIVAGTARSMGIVVVGAE